MILILGTKYFATKKTTSQIETFLSKDCQIREVLLKGKVQCSWSPSTNKFRSAPSMVKILFTFFTTQATFMRRSSVLSPPPSVSIPWSNYFRINQMNSLKQRNRRHLIAHQIKKVSNDVTCMHFPNRIWSEFYATFLFSVTFINRNHSICTERACVRWNADITLLHNGLTRFS